jgi:hypothetical protein
MNLFQVHPVGTTILNLAGVDLGILDALGDGFGISPTAPHFNFISFHILFFIIYQKFYKSQALTSTFS